MAKKREPRTFWYMDNHRLTIAEERAEPWANPGLWLVCRVVGEEGVDLFESEAEARAVALKRWTKERGRYERALENIGASDAV